MSCNKQQIQEAARKEYRRLEKLVEQGIYEDEIAGIDNIPAAMSAMALAANGSSTSREVYRAPKEVSREAVDAINDGKAIYGGRQVEVVRGYVRDGRAKLVVKDKEKGYYKTIDAALVYADSVSVMDKIRYSDETAKRVGTSENDEYMPMTEDNKIDLGTQMHDLIRNLEYISDMSGVGFVSEEFKQHIDELANVYRDTLAEVKMNNVTVEMFKNRLEDTGGEIDLDSRAIRIRWGLMSRLSSPHEVFMHEVGHLQAKGVLAENPEIGRVLQDLRNSAVESGIDYKIFLKKTDYVTAVEDGQTVVYERNEDEAPTPDEIKVAKAKFDYVFDKTADIEEFYAYATSNEQVWQAIQDVQIDSRLVKEVEAKHGEKLGKGSELLNKIIRLVNKLWIVFTGRGKKGGEVLADMVMRIANAQVELMQDSEVSEDNTSKSAYVKRKMQELDETVEPIATKISDWVSDVKSDKGDKLVKLANKIRPLRELLETGVAQYIWRMVAQDTTRENVADMYKVFRVSKAKVEKHTNDIRNGVQTVVEELYKDVDATTREAVVKLLLDGDLASIARGPAGIAKLSKYLNNDKARVDEIARLKEILRVEYSKEEYSEIEKQIEGLVEYLVSGKTSGLDQQINANNILVKVRTEEDTNNKYRANQEMVDAVDRIVTLQVVDAIDVDVKKSVIKLLKTEEGKSIVDKTVKMYDNYMDEMKENAIVGVYNPIPKGYTRVQDGLMKYELVSEFDVKAQLSVNMKLVSDKPRVVVDKVEYYLMVGRVKDVGFNEGALGVISNTLEGISISSLIRKSNAYREEGELLSKGLDTKVRAILEEMESGESKRVVVSEEANVVPVYNSMMEIVDYRIQVGKDEDLIARPDRERGLVDVLSNTFARSAKVTATAASNAHIVDTIIENTAEGIMDNPDNYVLVEEYTEEDRDNGVKRELRHDRWDRLPEYTKNYIYKKLGHNGIPIHKDFVELMMGEKDITIGNFAKWGIDLKRHPVARARLMALESYIKEILGYVKEAIVILNPNVLIGNTVSNWVVAIGHGVDPITYVKKAKQKWIQLNDYNEKLQLMTEMEVREKMGEDVGNKIKQLRKQLDENPFNDLVEDGQYSPIVEDVNVDLKPRGQLYRMMDEAISKNRFGDVIKTVKDIAYVSPGTKGYRLLLKAVHYGDIITRQIIKEELESKLKANGKWNDVEKQKMLNYLDQLLVNYGYTMNRWMSYAEKVGGLMFMKYYMAQGKALVSMTLKNPSKMLGIQGLQAISGVNVSDPIDTYLKNDLLSALSNRVLFDNLDEVLHPHLFEMIPDISSAITFRG